MAGSLLTEEAKALKEEVEDKKAADEARMREGEEKAQKKAAEESNALEKELEAVAVLTSDC